MPAVQRWSPVTHDFGVIRADIETVVACRRKMFENIGEKIIRHDPDGSLDACFGTLEPLASIPNKDLFLSTNTGWTYFFSNGIRGSDPFPVMSQLSRIIGLMAMRVCVSQAESLYPDVIWEVYDTPHKGADAYGLRRHIAAVKNGGTWTFHSEGNPFSFEDTSHFEAPNIRDRFTVDALQTNLGHFGLSLPEDKLFSNQKVVLERAYAKPAKLMSLEDVRNR